MKFENEIALVLKGRKTHSELVNVVDVLGYGKDQFQQAFDIALEMDNHDLVKLIYSNYNAGKVVVEFTLIGKAASHQVLQSGQGLS